MKPPPVTVIFCGQVRRPTFFLTALEKLLPLRENGAISQIIYSTWHGELEQYPDLFEFISRANIKIIATPEPRTYAGAGHVYFQKLVFANALVQLEPNEIVLRLRPDTLLLHRVDAPNLIHYLSAKINSPANPLGTLQRPIWVGKAITRHPFWLEDRYMAGLATDLNQLTDTSLDLEYKSHPRAAIAEANWYARPFFTRFQAVRDALRINWWTATIPGAKSKGARFRELSSKQPDMLRLLAAYHYILERSFYVGLPENILLANHIDIAPEPRPPLTDSVANAIAHLANASTTYRHFLDLFRADETQMNLPLLHEAQLEDDLVQIGTYLYPHPVVDARVPKPTRHAIAQGHFYENIRFGVTLHSDWLLARGSGWASISWANDNAINNASLTKKIYLLMEWHRNGVLIQTAPWVEISDIKRAGGEHDFPLHAPPKPGIYSLICKLGMDGVGWSARNVTLSINVVK